MFYLSSSCRLFLLFSSWLLPFLYFSCNFFCPSHIYVAFISQSQLKKKCSNAQRCSRRLLERYKEHTIQRKCIVSRISRRRFKSQLCEVQHGKNRQKVYWSREYRSYYSAWNRFACLPLNNINFNSTIRIIKHMLWNNIRFLLCSFNNITFFFFISGFSKYLKFLKLLLKAL